MNLSPWRILCISSKIEHHTMINMATILIKMRDDVFYLYDEFQKIEDVSKMSYYIKEDWINYNKKEVDLSVIDHFIKYFSSKDIDLHDDTVAELKSIRRDIQIKKIL